MIDNAHGKHSRLRGEADPVTPEYPPGGMFEHTRWKFGRLANTAVSAMPHAPVDRSHKKSFVLSDVLPDVLSDVLSTDLLGGPAGRADGPGASANAAAGGALDDLATATTATATAALGAATTADGRDTAPLRPSRQSVLADRAKEFIEQHLGDPGLSPSRVAAACHVSLRCLQDAFAVTGDSPAGWIRERRLQQARAELLTSDRSAAAIGARWGYPNPTSFGRAFRARFGAPPSTYRTQS